jgi:VWFA-related protein
MRIWLVVSLLMAASPALAQPSAVIRINVNLVQIDAVVTDSAGNAVRGLTPSDFEIRQDGKKQTITNFSFVSIDAPLQTRAPKKGLRIPPAILRAADVRRTIVFVIDDLFLPFADLVRVRESLKKTVSEQMQAGDLIAVIRTSGGMGAYQRFSSDPRQVVAALDHIQYNVSGRPRLPSFVPLSDDPLARAIQARDEMLAAGNLSAIRYVANGLREMPGRKTLVLISENLPLFRQPNFADPDAVLGPQSDLGGAVNGIAEALDRLIDAANRASIVVHTVDPRGLRVRDPGAGLSESIAELYAQDGLGFLAEKTGGLFLLNNNDIGGMVQRALKDSSSYYVMGYHPDADTFSMSASDVFHKLSVKCTRPGLQVRSRSGFFGEPDTVGGKPRPLAPLTSQAQLQRALDAPFSVGNIHLRLSAVFTDSPDSGPFLNTRLHIDGRDLLFTNEPGGGRKAVFDLLVATFGEKSEVVSSVNRTYTVRCKGEECGTERQQDLLYSLNFPVKKPGAYQMRVALHDAGSNDTGSASQFIEVPDVSKGRLTLSSLILRERPAGRVIDYGYQILNASTNGQHAPELEAQLLLFHEGEQVYTGPVTPLHVEGQTDARRLAAGGALELGNGMKPGDYVLEVVVTDKLAREKFQTASQWMDFEIQR